MELPSIFIHYVDPHATEKDILKALSIFGISTENSAIMRDMIHCTCRITDFKFEQETINVDSNLFNDIFSVHYSYTKKSELYGGIPRVVKSVFYMQIFKYASIPTPIFVPVFEADISTDYFIFDYDD